MKGTSIIRPPTSSLQTKISFKLPFVNRSSFVRKSNFTTINNISIIQIQWHNYSTTRPLYKEGVFSAIGSFLKKAVGVEEKKQDVKPVDNVSQQKVIDSCYLILNKG